MNFLHADIGSAKDNFKSPIHNWYKFTAGFSHKFVDEIIALENLKKKKDSQIFDPFAGCGTTLVSSQKAGVTAIGNEGQEFMYDVIRAKLNWRIEENEFEEYLTAIKNEMMVGIREFDFTNTPHPLLKSLYTEATLRRLYLIRDAVLSISAWKYKLFFKLALSQTLHKVSKHPIAVPYIVRTKTLLNTGKPWQFFETISRQMFEDTQDHFHQKRTSKIHLHDSRTINEQIDSKTCNSCITSPPYLNNLDYGEVSKVHSHFFEITNDWSDITKHVRKKLVTGSTTHYAESDFDNENFKTEEFYLQNRAIADSLLIKSETIKKISKERGGKKSFDILTLFYFQDMYDVLKEIRRVVRHRNNAYLILGDSAPYGIHIPTTELLGKIALNTGFSSYKIHKIRARGTKWKSLKYRHSLELTENVLILK
jgi:DNA modification methylase